MVSAALFTENLAYVAVAGAVGSLLLLWSVRWPSLAAGLLCASLLAGQVGRLPLPGQGGGLLLSDAAVALIILVALVAKYYHPVSPTGSTNPLLRKEGKVEFVRKNFISFIPLLIPWLLWSAFTLALRINDLAWPELLIAMSYWLRLATYLLVLPALASLVTLPAVRHRLRQLLYGLIVGLLVLGVGQLLLLPRLAVLGGGWDPHEGRLVATWLDPNFLGGFFIIVLPWIFCARRWGLGALCVIALLLTESRSSIISLTLACVILSPLYIISFAPVIRRRWPVYASVALTVLLMVGGLVAVLLGSRVTGLLTRDATVSLRLAALRANWPLAVAQPWAGVGYNAYQFAAQDAGLIDSFAIHSRAGTDNSVLTLWITTGILGVALFLVPWAAIALLAWRRWLQTYQVVYVGLLTSLLAWLIHAQFINSLLYGHLILTLVVVTVVVLRPAVTSDPL